MRRVILGIIILLGAALSSCINNQYDVKSTNKENTFSTDALRDSLLTIATSYNGEIGIALLTDDGDTVIINNEVKYPLMSVFKLHQAIALCHKLEQAGMSIDSVVSIDAEQLNPETWSPMLKERKDNPINISIRDLLRYTLIQSDNNASNYMFENISSTEETDSYISEIIPRDGFKIKFTEADMWDNHGRCYDNCSSPLSAALLINRLFTENRICPENRDFICSTLKQCQTGVDRILAPLAGKDGITVAHKTGSGFKDNGILSAHNDIAFITLPDGRHYTLAVFVKDFHGSETEAAKAIAQISATVYNAIIGSSRKSGA